jgi:hypothetical protein
MTALVSVLVASLFSFATGFFVALSYVEEPVWPLMFGAESEAVPDEDARLVHAELNRIIDLAPPTMATVVGSGSLLVFVQAWQHGFDWPAAMVAVWLVASMGYVVSKLRARIEAVKSVPSDGDTAAVRQGLGRLAALHHMGLLATAGVVVLQLVFVAVA